MCRSQTQREEDQEAALREVGEDYLEETFDSVAAKLHGPSSDVRVYDGSRRSQAQREEDQEAALREIGEDYLEETFDSVAAELARLPPGFDANMLDALVDRRSWVLEVRHAILQASASQSWPPPVCTNRACSWCCGRRLC